MTISDFVSSDYLVGGHFTRIQVQSQTPEHGLTLNSDSYLLEGQIFAAPRSLQSQKLTWASGAFEYETVHSANSTSGRNETKPISSGRRRRAPFIDGPSCLHRNSQRPKARESLNPF